MITLFITGQCQNTQWSMNKLRYKTYNAIVIMIILYETERSKENGFVAIMHG